MNPDTVRNIYLLICALSFVPILVVAIRITGVDRAIRQVANGRTEDFSEVVLLLFGCLLMAVALAIAWPITLPGLAIQTYGARVFKTICEGLLWVIEPRKSWNRRKARKQKEVELKKMASAIANKVRNK